MYKETSVTIEEPFLRGKILKSSVYLVNKRK